MTQHCVQYGLICDNTVLLPSPALAGEHTLKITIRV